MSEQFKLRILGCGASGGIPRIGNDWGECDPREARNRRTRASILVEAAGHRVLVDTGPDLRQQLLDADVGRVDAVIWTHDHADHTHGIDELRQIYFALGSPVPGYARPATFELLKQRFAYAFVGRDGYPALVQGQVLPTRCQMGPMTLVAFDQPHGSITSAGLRFGYRGKSIGYSTDLDTLTEDNAAILAGVDLWVVDALRRKPHPSHPHLDKALAWIARIQPRQAVLTHMDGSMDFTTLMKELPDGVRPGHDGMEIIL